MLTTVKVCYLCIYKLHFLVLITTNELYGITIDVLNILEYFTFIMYKILLFLYTKLLHNAWDVRKKFQSSLYGFHLYDGWNVYQRKLGVYFNKKEYNQLYKYIKIYWYNYLIIITENIKVDIIFYWTFICWFSWFLLSYILYYYEKLRDLGPSYDIYDYNPDDDMGLYLTIGPFIIVSWLFWTIAAKLAFWTFINACFYKFCYYNLVNFNWYLLTIYSYIENDRIFNLCFTYQPFYFCKLPPFNFFKFYYWNKCVYLF